MAHCTQCGGSVTVGSRFCAKCGAPVEDRRDASTQDLRRPSTESIALGEQRLLEALRHITLGEYEILGELGRGGMAVVFLAHDIALDRKVAIKVMSPALLLMDPGVQDRFKREARTAAALSHPHIIPVYAVRESKSLVYFVMKYVAGRSLESVMRESGPLPIGVVQTVLHQAGSALGHAHRNGVVHRDVKPANIMLDEDGWAIVTDFGIAKVAQAQALTQTGGVVGTPSYMSPEQAQGRELDGASDQYSLGVVAYEMIAGRQPFESGTMINLMYDHCHTPPPLLRELRADCPAEVAGAVMRMLEKDPAQRWPSIEEAVAAIGTVSDSQHGRVRTSIQTMLQATPESALLRKFRTPGSPVPRGNAPPPTRPRGAKQPGADAAERSQPAVAALPLGQRRRVAWWAAPVVVVLAVGGWGLFGRGDTTAGAVAPTEATGTPAGEPAIAASLDLTPYSVDLVVGEAATLTAVARDAAGAELAAVPVRYAAEDPGIATVSSSGVVTGSSEGMTRVTARAGSVASTIVVRVAVAVRPPPAAQVRAAPQVTTVRVDPVAVDLVPGNAAQLIASVLDQYGDRMGEASVTWRSSSPGVADVSADGRVTAIGEGSTTITASLGARSGAAAVTVGATPAASVMLDPSRGTLDVGDALQLTATVRDDAGRALPGRAVAWRSSDPGVVTVTAVGLARAVAPGTATVSASSGAASGTTTVTVRAAAAPAPPSAPVNHRPALDAVLERYRQAIESEDLARLRAAYPGMTAEQERAWRQFFASVSDLRAGLEVVDMTIEDRTARARVQATYEFHTNRQERQSFTFAAAFVREGDTWRLEAIQ